MPVVTDVKSGVQYGANGTQYTGTYKGLTDQWDSVIEDVVTARQLMRVMSSVLIGKVSGMNTNTPSFRDLADTKNRISAVTDTSGNRNLSLLTIHKGALANVCFE